MPYESPPIEVAAAPEQAKLSEIYKHLSIARAPVLARARTYSEYVMPGLIMPEGATDATQLAEPFSNIATRGAVFLTNRLDVTMFPANTSFMVLEPDPLEMMAIQRTRPDFATEIKDSFREIETAVAKEIERRNWRPQINYALLLDVVTGNHCNWFREGGALSIYALDQYVAGWDPAGHSLETVICERINYRALAPDMRRLVGAASQDGTKYTNDSELELYTGAVLQLDGTYSVWQEVAGYEVPGSRRNGYTAENVPIRPTRFTKTRAQYYGTGRVGQFFADIKSLDGLSRCILEASAACARVLWGVKPTAYTSIRAVNETPNGGYVAINKDDIFPITAEKYADLQVAKAEKEELVKAISYAFLLTSAIQRNAERVTAEEFRLMANELQDTLGGTYPALGQEMQVPIATIVLSQLQVSKRMPKLPPNVRVKIITGIEALNQNHELGRLQTAAATMTQTGVPPEVWIKGIEVTELLHRVFESSGVDTKNLVKTREEVVQQQQQEQAAALAHSVAPDVVKAVSDHSLQANDQAQAAAPAAQ